MGSARDTLGFPWTPQIVAVSVCVIFFFFSKLSSARVEKRNAEVEIFAAELSADVHPEYTRSLAIFFVSDEGTHST